MLHGRLSGTWRRHVRYIVTHTHTHTPCAIVQLLSYAGAAARYGIPLVGYVTGLPHLWIILPVVIHPFSLHAHAL